MFKNFFCRSVLFFFAATVLPLLSHGRVPDACKAIDCGCKALEFAPVSYACLAREQVIKTQCQADDGVVSLHCGWHSVDAQPLALSLRVNKPKSYAEETAATYHQALFNSLYMDLKLAQQDLNENALLPANTRVKSANNNLKELFAIQTARVQALSEAQAEPLWRDYYEQLNKAASPALKLEASSWLMAESTSVKKEMWQAMALRMSINAGALLDQLGFAAEQFMSSQEVAELWQNSAAYGEAAVQEVPGSLEFVTGLLRAKAAQRYYRAAWYWLKAEQYANAGVAEETANNLLGVSMPLAAVLVMDEQAVALTATPEADPEPDLEPQAEDKPTQLAANGLSKAKAWREERGVEFSTEEAPAGAQADEQSSESSQQDGAAKWGIPRRFN